MPFVDVFQIFGERDTDADPIGTKREYRERCIEDEIRIINFGDTRIFASKTFPFFFGNNEWSMFLKMNTIGTMRIADR
jgi:hypothetical protein